MSCIPDNVDTTIYRGERRHTDTRPVRLVWSGVGKKAAHLLAIVDALAELEETELVLVVDETPDCLPALQRAIPCRVVKFSDGAYARVLRSCDIVISPKRLVNAYEMGHTEYKITLGMAVGLPAVASPQLSYLEAIGHDGGGLIADDVEEWMQALKRLVADPALRADLGARARRTVVERYATPVIAARYLELILGLIDPARQAASPARPA